VSRPGRRHVSRDADWRQRGQGDRVHQDNRLLLSSSFGAAAAACAEHRPDYAKAAVRWTLERAPGQRLLDLGAGTGKLTAELIALGAEVIAVEPDPTMLAELRREIPAVHALPGSAEAIPLADASVDAVLAGTAMHWFDMDVAGPEVARVLSYGPVAGMGLRVAAAPRQVRRTPPGSPRNRYWARGRAGALGAQRRREWWPRGCSSRTALRRSDGLLRPPSWCPATTASWSRSSRSGSGAASSDLIRLAPAAPIVDNEDSRSGRMAV
jgi:SAM-dependent methyltransferase